MNTTTPRETVRSAVIDTYHATIAAGGTHAEACAATSAIPGVADWSVVAVGRWIDLCAAGIIEPRKLATGANCDPGCVGPHWVDSECGVRI